VQNQDFCNGSGCADYGFKPNTTPQPGASQGDQCDDDAADRCTGTNNACVDVFKASGTSCGNNDTACAIRTPVAAPADSADNGF
jgi:hypothetical protein